MQNEFWPDNGKETDALENLKTNDSNTYNILKQWDILAWI